MTKTIKLLTTVMTVLLMSSFTTIHSNEFIGTYGVPSSDPSRIKLTLYSNNTFYYQDYSASNKKIVVSGTWSMKGNKVVLKNTGSEIKFHDVWSFTAKGQVAKSRKGLAFYRLCKISS